MFRVHFTDSVRWILRISLGLTLLLSGCQTTEKATYRSGTPLAGPLDIAWEGESGLDSTPRLKGGMVPSQPYMQFQESGWATVAFTVLPSGRTSNIEVVASEGKHFGGNTAEAIRFWNFEPARRGGKPVACRGRITWEFMGRDLAGIRPRLSVKGGE